MNTRLLEQRQPDGEAVMVVRVEAAEMDAPVELCAIEETAALVVARSAIIAAEKCWRMC